MYILCLILVLIFFMWLLRDVDSSFLDLVDLWVERLLVLLGLP